MRKPWPARTFLPFSEVISWRVFVRRLGYEIDRDNVLGRAAELAYFFLFSVFPLLLVLTNVLGMVSAGSKIQDSLERYFSTAMPPAAYRLISSTLEEISQASDGGKLSLGIFMTLASASSGMVAIIEGLNTAYDVREARSWWRRRLVAVALTIALAVFTITALAIMLYGSELGGAIASRIGARAVFQFLWNVLQWPAMVGFILLGFSLIYRFAPNLRDQRWHWILPGAGTALLVWVAASLGLRLYLRFFDAYSTTYGSLGALIVLMIWFYLFGAAILIGGEVNSIIEQSAARAGDPEAKLPGEKAPGEAAT